MKVWIDQDLCTGDGLCVELTPAIFFMSDDGLAYVKDEDEKAANNPRLKGAGGLANVPDSLLESVVESAEECPRRVYIYRGVTYALPSCPPLCIMAA